MPNGDGHTALQFNVFSPSRRACEGRMECTDRRHRYQLFGDIGNTILISKIGPQGSRNNAAFQGVQDINKDRLQMDQLNPENGLY